MKHATGLLTTREEISNLSKTLLKEDHIAFDTEFIRETSFFPKIEILQVATQSENFLVDAGYFFSKDKEGLYPLWEVFRNPNILKIGHALQADQECLYTAFGIVATPSMDTAVAASLCGYGDNIGLGNLLSKAMGVEIKKGHARTNWSQRPLPPALIEYAVGDVEYLVELGEKLTAELEKSGRRQWALDVSKKFEDIKLYEADPVGLATKYFQGGKVGPKDFQVLVELFSWRESRVRDLNRPRRWIADDSVILDLMRVQPKDMEHLLSFRGINRAELEKSGRFIIEAIQRGQANKSAKAPTKLGKPEVPTQDEAQTLQLVQCFLAILADSKKISQRLLISAPKLLKIIRFFEDNSETDSKKIFKQLIDSDLVDTHVMEMVGEDLICFFLGKLFFGIKNGKVEMQGKAPN